MTTHRSAAEIGTTEQGPRPLPALTEQRKPAELGVSDTVLSNGLRVLVVRKSTVPMVELRLRVPLAGDDPLHPATAELLAENILTGTQRRDRVAMDTDLALIGGELGTIVDPERLTISGSALASGTERLFDVLADAVTDAAYRGAEVDAERARLAERLAVAWSQPSVIARDALQRHRYGDHPYAREVPQVADLNQVSAADVLALHRKAVLPRGSIMVVVGDVDPEHTVELIERAFAGWESAQEAKSLAPLPELTGANVALVHRPGAVQSQIRLSAQAIDRTDPRYPALQLANFAYGGYFSSRLVENIREDKGYTYGAHSRFEFTPGAATIGVDADTASDVTAAALWETRYELGKMAVVPPSEDEIESVRQYAIGVLLTASSSQGGLASQLAAIAAAGLDASWLVEHPARLSRVSVEDVAEAAQEFFAPTRFSGVVVGDAEVLAAKLGALGGVDLP